MDSLMVSPARNHGGLIKQEFLPDFCHGRTLFNAMLLAESLAIIMTITGKPITNSLFRDLLLISLYVQWIAIFSVASLCYLRPYLNRLPPLRAGLMAYLLMLAIALLVGELAMWVLWAIGFLPDVHPEWYGVFQLRNLTIAIIIDGLALHYLLARHQLRNSVAAEARARLQIMQYRLRPHFLFNSMNIIASLTRSAPSKAEAATEDLADLFRLMLDDRKDLVTVQNEISVARKYIKLERIRLDNRLRVDWHTETLPLHARMPVLMLQLILEICIRQSLERTGGSAVIDVTGSAYGEQMNLSICCPQLPEPAVLAEQEQEALDNIRERLRDTYAERATLILHEKNDSRCIELKLPVHESIAHENTDR
jgi:two-component system sensor histidine kinase AlgZ